MKWERGTLAAGTHADSSPTATWANMVNGHRTRAAGGTRCTSRRASASTRWGRMGRLSSMRRRRMGGGSRATLGSRISIGNRTGFSSGGRKKTGKRKLSGGRGTGDGSNARGRRTR